MAHLSIKRGQPMKLLFWQVIANVAVLHKGRSKWLAFAPCRSGHALNDTAGRFLADVRGKCEHCSFGERKAA